MPTTLLVIGLALGACERGAEPGGSHAPETGPATTPGAAHSRSEFARLRWLEGTWRGSGAGQPTFYERYTFVDDSTLRAESSPDSTFPDPAEAGSIELRAGRITTGGGDMLWAATRLDDRSVRFDPVRGARNTFVWTRASDSVWTARLTWRDDEGEPHELLYTMRRMP